MPSPAMSHEKLEELLLKKAVEPPPEANLILANHLRSRESCDLAHAVSEAMSRHAAAGTHRLPTPPDLLAPLG